uniref:Reverse transcriptase domain-containing protein n=1 Tax=Pararge aegeria TaxID=116150 RepID=S4PNH0_9NEOP
MPLWGADLRAALSVGAPLVPPRDLAALRDDMLPTIDRRVTAIDHLCRIEEISCGVPPGSVLGPYLFRIYINGLSLATNPKTFQNI